MTHSVAPQPAVPTYKPLRRSRSNRVLGGVCAGVARYLDIDPVAVRILAVVLTLFSGGGGLLAYLVAWIVMPDEPAVATWPSPAGYPTPTATGQPGYPPAPGTAPVPPAWSATAPGQPVQPVEPVAPGQPVEPAQAAQAVEPVQPVEPAQAVEPVGSVDGPFEDTPGTGRPAV